MRTGILGGTFNPPHLGHLIAAQEAYRELDLDRVILIPAGIPPHKPVEDEPGPEHRLELCRLAIGDDGHLDRNRPQTTCS
jgi:nicotinate-nucleotide adenylyltransferase